MPYFTLYFTSLVFAKYKKAPCSAQGSRLRSAECGLRCGRVAMSAVAVRSGGVGCLWYVKYHVRSQSRDEPRTKSLKGLRDPGSEVERGIAEPQQCHQSCGRSVRSGRPRRKLRISIVSNYQGDGSRRPPAADHARTLYAYHVHIQPSPHMLYQIDYIHGRQGVPYGSRKSPVWYKIMQAVDSRIKSAPDQRASYGHDADIESRRREIFR